jgi:hypothetical protein
VCFVDRANRGGISLRACALGSIAFPITNEMIHVFIVDDAPDQFGDLSDDWIKQAIGF